MNKSWVVVSLTDVISLINRFPHFSGKTILSRSANLLIAYLHGFSTGIAINKAMKQIVEGTTIPLHDGRAAVDQLLYSIPLFSADDSLMAVFDDLPFITGDFVDDVGTSRLLMAFTDYMITLVNRVVEHLSNHRTAPRIIADFGFHRLFKRVNGILRSNKCLAIFIVPYPFSARSNTSLTVGAVSGSIIRWP